MKVKKIFILLPDGVGLRNFAFTSFAERGKKLRWEVVFWNLTPFDLKELGLTEIHSKGKPRAFTDLLKRAKILSELTHFEQIFEDSTYQSYIFPSSNRSLKEKIKNRAVSFLTSFYKGSKGLSKLRTKMKSSERKSYFYKNCRAVLEKEKPDYVFCTNQRPSSAIAPLTAAQDLNIPTGTFIFSWDNLPKATMVVEPDHYFVWSEHMKQELLKYYPFIKPKNIFVTGSPQFEPHFQSELRKSRQDFFKEHRLDEAKEYICFSGDDETTSPDDPQYLQDLAKAVEELNNKKGYHLGILFRRSPVDFSDRYDAVIKKHRHLIDPVIPKWKRIDKEWNAVMPMKEDLELQMNTILHTRAVVNLGSSMVFDYAAFGKPYLYLNYDVDKKKDPTWSTKKIYKFVHFRSIDPGKEVIWLKAKEEIAPNLETVLTNSLPTVEAASLWFKKINLHPPQNASKRIWKVLNHLA